MEKMNRPILKWYYERKLRIEREKLSRLIDAAMDEPIALNQDILDQSHRVDMLILRLQEKGKGEHP
jgi:hypothetical protein